MQERVGNLEKDLALKEAELAAVHNTHADNAAAAAAEASVAGVPGSEEAAAATAAAAAEAGGGTLSHSPSERSLQEFAAQFKAAVRALRQWMQDKGLLDQPMVCGLPSCPLALLPRTSTAQPRSAATLSCRFGVPSE